MTGTRLLPALALTALLAACGSGDDNQAGDGSSTAPSAPSASSTAAPDGTAAPSTDGDDGTDGDGSDHAPPFPANTAPDHGDASAGAFGNITDVRLGHHDGFDRVVFEFHGAGTPGWTVQYVPQALSQGSGAPIDLAGNAVLSVVITGVGIPPDTGVDEFPRGTVRVADTHVVTEAFFDGTFEGISQAFVGTTAQQPFRVYLLTDPARIVLEVREH